MVKNRKITLSIFTALMSTLLLISLANAAGLVKICLREGESIDFTECNEAIGIRTCEDSECQYCVQDKGGYYCQAPLNACDDACVYLYSNEENSTVTLVSPDPDETLEPGYIDFTFHITLPSRLERCDLYINDERKKYTTNIDPDETLRVKLSDEGAYEWRIECKEKVTYGGETIISASRILNIGEVPEDPTEDYDILAVSPEEGTTLTNEQQVTFAYKISEKVLSEAETCNLIMDGNKIRLDEELTAEDSITTTIGIGNHLWKIQCGTYETQEKTLIINSPPPTTPQQTSGGGGGGGGGSSSTRPISYAPSKAQIAEGYTKQMKEEDKVRFQIGEEEHTITILEVSENSAKIKIESNPIEKTLTTNQEEKFELNGDDYYDLSIKLNGIKSGKADLTIKTIHEEIETQETEHANQQEPETTTEEQEEQQETNTPITGAAVGIIDRINNNRTPIIAAVIIIAVIIALMIGNKKQKK